MENRYVGNSVQDFTKVEKKYKEPPPIEKTLYHLSWEIKSISARLQEINDTLKQFLINQKRDLPF